MNELNQFKTVAIIPAAGAGVRMGANRAKQFLTMEGRPLLALTLEPFQQCRLVDAVIVVVPREDLSYCQNEVVEQFGLNKVKRVVAGGQRRQDSVRLGLEAAGGSYHIVLVHDGVRPMVSAVFISRIIESARTHRAVIPGVPATDTVKEVDPSGAVVRTYDRERVWLVQTPQAYRYEDLMKAHVTALDQGGEWEATDDASLIERLGIPVTVIQGMEDNIKVTTPRDLDIVRFFLRKSGQ